MEVIKQPRAVEAVKVAKSMEVTVLPQALPQVNEGVQAPVAAIIAGVVEVVEVTKVVEVAKLPRALPKVLLIAVVAHVVTTVVPVVCTKSNIKFKFKIKFKQKK